MSKRMITCFNKSTAIPTLFGIINTFMMLWQFTGNDWYRAVGALHGVMVLSMAWVVTMRLKEKARNCNTCK